MPQSETGSIFNEETVEPYRPFLQYWDLMWEMEKKRQAGAFSKDRHQMTLEFINSIGVKNFMEEARKTFALEELALYYDIDLNDDSQFGLFISNLRASRSHMDVFDFAIYFAAWVKSEVAVSKRMFKEFDEVIE